MDVAESLVNEWRLKTCLILLLATCMSLSCQHLTINIFALFSIEYACMEPKALLICSTIENVNKTLEW